MVETLGSEVFLHLACGAHALVARMDVPDSPLSVGQTVQLDLKMLRTHVFDKETERSIV